MATSAHNRRRRASLFRQSPTRSRHSIARRARQQTSCRSSSTSTRRCSAAPSRAAAAAAAGGHAPGVRVGGRESHAHRIAELRAHRLAQLRECLEPLEVWNEQFQSQAPRHIRESAVPMANMIEVSRVQQEQKRSIGRDACSCGALARERCSARTRCGCQRGGGACFAEAHSMGLASA